jgi:SNF2 family DNA or RNA helicase
MNLERYALYPHQVTGVGFLATRGRAILGDDTGLGKTRQAIIAMKEAAPEGVFLVICPASLKLNWAREISVVDPLARLEVLGVAGYEHPQPQWVIVNYDLLARHGERLRTVRYESRRSGSGYACDLDRADDVRAPAHMRAFSAMPGDVALRSK